MGGRQYPVWIDINSCAYSNPKSYGIRRHGEQTIYVGSSKKNSHKFADISIACKERQSDNHKPKFREFVLKVDGEVVKQMTYDIIKKEMCENTTYNDTEGGA